MKNIYGKTKNRLSTYNFNFLYFTANIFHTRLPQLPHKTTHMKALFIGRFQPFHNGHLQAIRQIIKENELTYIGIGSTNENTQPLNPFTCAERYEMIESALTATKIPPTKFRIIPIPNISNYALWPAHIETYIPPFEKIYTGSPIVKQLFTDYNGKIKKPYTIKEITKDLPISATQVRELMLTNKKWEMLVPKTTSDLINKWNGVQRIKNIN